MSFSDTEEICIRGYQGYWCKFPGADLLDPFMMFSFTYNLGLRCAIFGIPVTITELGQLTN